MSRIGTRSSSTSTKRGRSRSLSSCDQITRLDDDLFIRKRPPLSGHDLDKLNYHVYLQDFGSQLQRAANAIFPGDQISRYTEVHVILLSWFEEDPRLPVSLEINALAEVFSNAYGFEVEQWLIPSDNSHNKLQTKILNFLGDDNTSHLKIVYYAGHGKLTNHGTLAWTSWQNSRNDRCPTVKWSSIQSTLEESHSDVLILLDCCSSGVCTTDEGNGVTELIAACAYNAIANGVGPFSFTHALISRLRMLAPLPYFTIGFLYNSLFTEIQSWRVEDSRYKKAPIHLVLNQNNDRPRSIRLSSRLSLGERDHRSNSSDVPVVLDPPMSSLSLNNKSSAASIASIASSNQQKSTSGDSPSLSQTSTSSRRESGLWLSPSPASSLELPEYPRLLFSIRIQEDVKSGDLSIEMFTDWLRDVPVSSCLIRVEAGFASDSTILMVSMPAAMIAHLPSDPAIIMLGVIRSKNLLISLNEPAQTGPIGSVDTTATAPEQDPSTPIESTSIPQVGIGVAVSDEQALRRLPERLRNLKGRHSVSTIGTMSSGTAQSAYTQSDEISSDGRASVMTSMSSITTGSIQYAFVPPVIRPPKHDPVNGLWNGVLRVIPCNNDHSGQLWDDSFTTFSTCTICGFSKWHGLMLIAQNIGLEAFMTAMEGFRGSGSPLDYAGNSSAHYLMSAGFDLDYLRRLHWMEARQEIYGQNVFGQNPLHVLNPSAQGQELIRLLEWFKTIPAVRFPPGILLTQRDIHGHTPLHALLCRPLERDLYAQIFKVFPFAEHQLRTIDVSGKTVFGLMNQAALKAKLVSEDDYTKFQNGILEVNAYLDRTGGTHADQEYGFNEIARGGKGTSWPSFFECRVCKQINAHSSSYLDLIKCACAQGRDRGASDSSGLTPAHALITCMRAAPDGTHETPTQTAELFRFLVPTGDTALREVLHVLDPEGNSLVHNVAVRGFHEILEYILILEQPERRRSMVNACVNRQRGEISVLAAVEEELQKISERIRTANSFLRRDPLHVRFLNETRNQLLKVKQILQNAGAEMNPSLTTRWRIT